MSLVQYMKNLLSNGKIWRVQQDSNLWHAVLETAALPTELYPYMATAMGLEPMTSGVTGRRSTLLSYAAVRNKNTNSRDTPPLLVLHT